MEYDQISIVHLSERHECLYIVHVSINSLCRRLYLSEEKGGGAAQSVGQISEHEILDTAINEQKQYDILKNIIILFPLCLYNYYITVTRTPLHTRRPSPGFRLRVQTGRLRLQVFKRDFNSQDSCVFLTCPISVVDRFDNSLL